MILRNTLVKVVEKVKDYDFKGIGKFMMYLVKETHTTSQGLTTDPRTILVFERGSASAMLLTDGDEMLLIEQLRVPTLSINPSGTILEILAGMIDPGEKGARSAVREALEETGYAVKRGSVKFLFKFFSSPGIMTETISLYHAEVDKNKKESQGGGLATEGEDIVLHWVSRSEVAKILANGEIIDGKTIIAIQWWLAQK